MRLARLGSPGGWRLAAGIAMRCLLGALATVPAAPPRSALGQEADPWRVTEEQIDRARTAPLFATDEVLDLTLTAPFGRIAREDRTDEAPERPATLTFNRDGAEVDLEITVQTRGNWRRDARNCDFPPLWLDLTQDDPALEGTAFEGQNRLKLYVTCRKDRDIYEQYILQEYLVYPTYNLLTERSFRARLVSVLYRDSEDPEASFRRYAFLLEHKDPMSARNRAVPLDAPQVHPAQMSGEDAALLAVFNYMVGMTDWTSVYMHNVETIRVMDDGSLVPVGYDFDWSGIVDTRYAEPSEKLPIRNVRERIYQGFCRELDYDGIFRRFQDRKEEILGLWRSFELLDEDRREDAVEYLESFFERIEDPGRRGRILRDCIPIPR